MVSFPELKFSSETQTLLLHLHPMFQTIKELLILDNYNPSKCKLQSLKDYLI